jgi:hypothetical protein
MTDEEFEQLKMHSTDFIPFGGHREDSETLPYGCYLEGEKPKNAR